MAPKYSCILRVRIWIGRAGPQVRFLFPKTLRQAIEKDIDHRRGVKRQHLAYKQPAHHTNSQWPSQLRTVSAAESKRKSAKQRGHCRHHDRAEAQEAGFVNRIGGVLPVFALRLKSEVDDHNSDRKRT